MDSPNKISSATLKRPDKLVVDANPIISALLGGAALRVFWSPSLKEFVTTKFTINEILPYLPRLAKKISVPEPLLRLELELLPLTIYEKDWYQGQITEAKKRIGDRDPNDVDLLALALTLGCPVWSNDHDFEDTGVVLFTTANLLRSLQLEEP